MCRCSAEVIVQVQVPVCRRCRECARCRGGAEKVLMLMQRCRGAEEQRCRGVGAEQGCRYAEQVQRCRCAEYVQRFRVSARVQER